MEKVFNAINLGLIVVDTDCKVLLWNDWVSRHSLISEHDAVGHKLTGLFPEPLPAAFLNAMKNTLKYGIPTLLSNALHRSPLPLYDLSEENHSKTRVHQSVMLTPILSQQGEQFCMIQIKDATTSLKREKMLRSYSENLKLEATTDSLTEIYNRRFFDEQYKIALGNAIMQQHLLSVFMVDIDFFKDYNDYYGHLSGDMVIKAVAQTLKSQLSRANDVVARFGGEEFVLIFSNMTPDNAEKIAERLRKAVFDLAIPHIKSVVFNRVTVSIGLCTGIPKIEVDILSQADSALYLAKQNGRNQCVALSL